MIKPSQPRLWRERENKQTGLRPMEMHPLLVLCTTFPPEGELFFPLYNEQLKLAQGVSEEQICPSGEDAAAGGKRGCISSHQRRGCMVFPARRAVCLFPLGRQPGCKGFSSSLVH